MKDIDKRNYTIKRGDPGTLSFYVYGKDITAQKIIYAVKANKNLNEDNLILKRNSLAGRNDQELLAVFDGLDTRIDVKLVQDDTFDFTALKYVSDITSQTVDNSTDPLTVAEGDLIIDQDVQNPLSGTNLPAQATRWVNVDFSESEVGDLIQCQEVNGIKTGVLITLEELAIMLKPILDNL